MGRFLDRVIGIIGFSDDYDDDLEEEGYREEPEEEKRPRSSKRQKQERETVLSEPLGTKEPAVPLNPFRDRNAESKKQAPVVNVYSQKQVKVIVVEPVSFEECQGIAEHLKARKSVILNLDRTDFDLAQRIVDFISGTTYALGGNMQKVGNGIFMFVPSNVDISGEVSFRSAEKDLFWNVNG